LITGYSPHADRRREKVRNDAALIGRKSFWPGFASGYRLCVPPVYITSAIRPLGQCSPQGRMVVAIGDRDYTLVQPLIARELIASGLKSIDWVSAAPRIAQGLEQILDWRVLGRITDENQLELIE
jgi:hypothetical protein